MKTIEKTLILAKTDVLERGLLGRILQRFEDAGLKIVAGKLVQPNKTLANKHYKGTKKWRTKIGNKVIKAFKQHEVDIEKHFETSDPLIIGEKIHEWSVEYLTKNPVFAMVIEGPHAVDRVEQITGQTEPKEAGRGTIRGDFCVDSILHSNLQQRAIYNLIHSSSSKKNAKREINIWFKPNEILGYTNNYELSQTSK